MNGGAALGPSKVVDGVGPSARRASGRGRAAADRRAESAPRDKTDIRSHVELTRPPHGLQLKPIIELGLENLERYALRFRHRRARMDRTAFLRERPVYTGVGGTVEHVDATKVVQEQAESATGARHGEGVLTVLSSE